MVVEVKLKEHQRQLIMITHQEVLVLVEQELQLLIQLDLVTHLL